MSLGDSDKLCTAGRPPVTPEPSHTRPPASALLSSSLCRPRRGRGHGHSGPRWCPAWRGEWDPDVGRCPGCEGWPVTAVEGAPGTGAGKGAVTPRRSDCAGRPGRAGRGRGWCWPLEEGPGTPKARIRPRGPRGRRDGGAPRRGPCAFVSPWLPPPATHTALCAARCRVCPLPSARVRGAGRDPAGPSPSPVQPCACWGRSVGLPRGPSR